MRVLSIADARDAEFGGDVMLSLRKSFLFSGMLLAALQMTGCSSSPEPDSEAADLSVTTNGIENAAIENVSDNLDAAAETVADRKARLREKAKTDPEGANAEAIDNMSRNEVIATAINSAGFLCARVTSVIPLGSGELQVQCIEYRSGQGRVAYRINANEGRVEQLN